MTKHIRAIQAWLRRSDDPSDTMDLISVGNASIRLDGDGDTILHTDTMETTGSPGSPAVPAVPEVPAVPAFGPWAYLRFEDNLNDESGNNRTPASAGISFRDKASNWTAYGKVGVMRQDVYIRWSDAPSPRSPFTLFVWVLDQSGSDNNIMRWGNFTLDTDNSNFPTVSFGGVTNAASSGFVNASGLFHAFVWDGTDFKWYINGTLRHTWSDVAESNITDSSTLEFVGSTTVNDLWNLDQFQLYEAALTAAQVAPISGE